MKEKKPFRPLPVSRIKNNALRRFLMVMLFVPLVLTHYGVHVFGCVLFLMRVSVISPVTLFKSGMDNWKEALGDKKNA